MKISNFFSRWFALLLAIITLNASQANGSPLPINDNTSAPYLGVTENSAYNSSYTDYYTWLNRSGPKQYMGVSLPYGDTSTWDSIAGNPGSFYVPNKAWVDGDPANRTLVICTPMFPGPVNRSGPTTGTMTGSVTFLAGATGTYSWAYQGLAQHLVANNMGNSIIRLGWEFNGNWYAWHLNTTAEVSDFVSYWKNIVNTMRAVPGASGLKFMWSGAILTGTPYALSAAYPTGTDALGLPYVDYVGTDAYDKCWTAGTYPYPAGATDAQKLACQTTAWGVEVGVSGNGIGAWQNIANANGVPMCFPEWGLYNFSTAGGGDNPYFVQQMYNYIQESSHNVFLASYFDTYNKGSKISPVWGNNTSFPNASAKMISLYGIPMAYTSVSAGNAHTVALADDGTVWSWGSSAAGQVGNGGWGDYSSPVQSGAGTLGGVIGIAAGYQHTLAVTNAGNVWVWGHNYFNELGDGTTSTHNRPEKLTSLTNVVSVAAGAYHSLALKSDGTVWAWGYNSNGQIGNGGIVNQSTPVQVTGLTGVVAIGAGGYHSFAIKSDGTLWSWGRNFNGQLGLGNTAEQHSPVQVATVSNVVSVAGGASHTLIAKSDGTVWACGLNTNGQLGDGTTSQRTTPVQMTSVTGRVIQVSAGSLGAHSLLLKNDGSVWATGLNTYGQLATGDTTQQLTPVKVSGATGFARAIAAGTAHSIMIRTVDTIWAWGLGADGELGNGTLTTSQLTPIITSDF